MPQSWPSQWVVLFAYFIIAFLFVLALVYFSGDFFKKMGPTVRSKKGSSLIWEW